MSALRQAFQHALMLQRSEQAHDRDAIHIDTPAKLAQIGGRSALRNEFEQPQSADDRRDQLEFVVVFFGWIGIAGMLGFAWHRDRQVGAGKYHIRVQCSATFQASYS